MDSKTKLIWLDMEMSGLEVKENFILQIAIIVTDSLLNEYDEGIDLVINQPQDFYKKLDKWNFESHQKTGLIDRCINSKITLEKAEETCIKYILKYTKSKESPLCGNTVSHDIKFLHKYMPKFYSLTHYRSLDVSSLKIIKEMNFPNIKDFEKKHTHNALNDVRESIEEFKYYKKYILSY